MQGRVLMLAALAGVPATLWAQAADYPKPGATLRYIVPFPPGGWTDVMARLVGQQLGERWKVNVVIDNRPGGGGQIGAEVLKLMTSPDIEVRGRTQGFRIDGRGPQAFALFLKTETERWAQLIVAAKVTAA